MIKLNQLSLFRSASGLGCEHGIIISKYWLSAVYQAHNLQSWDANFQWICFDLVIAQYEFGIASLLNKKELLQIGDPVQFQVHITEDFAVNIQATREKLRSNVEAMKGIPQIISP